MRAVALPWHNQDETRRREHVERQKAIMARAADDLERRVRSLEARIEALERGQTDEYTDTDDA